MDFDPTLLRALVAVKETGGFTRAAERLHLTQSAVSHQIRKLEEQVGRALLSRTTRTLSLTDDGLEFLRYAEQILISLDALANRFQSSPLSGVVRFGVPESFMGERLAPLLSRYARSFPSVRLDVTVSTYLDLRSMIDANELDLAVVLATLDSKGGRVLRRTQFVWTAAKTFDIPIHKSLPLAFAPMPCTNRQIATAALDRSGLQWHSVFTSQSQQAIRAAVLAGLAITAVTRGEVETDMTVVDAKFGLPPLPKVDFRLISSTGGKTPAIDDFGKLLVSLSKSPG